MARGGNMKTKTKTITSIKQMDSLGSTYEVISCESVSACDYKGKTISGSLFSLNKFVNVTFTGCVFFSNVFENCEFRGCHFIDCTFQFCNFKSNDFVATQFQNCSWTSPSLKLNSFTSCELDLKTAYYSSQGDNHHENCYKQALKQSDVDWDYAA